MPIVDINGTAVEFPDDLTGDALNAAVRMAAGQMAMRPAQPAERSAGESVQRGVGLFGRGLNDAIGATVAAPVEAANWLMKQPGRLAEMAGASVPNVLPEGGFYTSRAQGALNALGRNDTPESAVEKLAYGAGQGAGNVVSMMAPAGAVARLAAPGTVTQSVARAMTAQPALQMASGVAGGAVGEATDNPIAGMAAGLAVPLAYGALRTAVSPGGARPSEETRRLVEVAKAEGIPLTPGQTTGSRPLRTTESVFATLPSTAGRQADMNQAQLEAWNRAVLARAGVQGESLATPDVVNRALDSAGGRMRAIYNQHDWNADPATMSRVLDVSRQARRELTRDNFRTIRNRVEDLIDKVSVQSGSYKVDGKAFGALDSEISKELRTTTGGKEVEYLRKLQDALRDAYQSTLPQNEAEALALARRQYANGMLILRAMNSPNANTAAGNIPPAALSQAVAAGPRQNYARGRGDLNDLARVGRAFIQDAIPNSGTPERTAIQNILTGSMIGGGGLAGGVEGASLGLLAGLGGPRMAQSVYYSPIGRGYLTNQLAERFLPRMSPDALRAIGAGQVRGLLD